MPVLVFLNFVAKFQFLIELVIKTNVYAITAADCQDIQYLYYQARKAFTFTCVL